MIGIFDSGVGGLSILEAIRNQLPKQNILYLADQANFPYGKKSVSELKEIAGKNSQFLIDKGADLIVVACNTLTTNTINYLRSQFKLPFIGVEPTVKLASEKSQTGHILVLSTSSTQKSSRLKKLIDKYTGHQQLYNLACPELVDLVEAGQVGDKLVRKALTGCLKPCLEDKKIDMLSLSCTHFSLVTEQIKVFFEEKGLFELKLITPGLAVARQTNRLLYQNKIKSEAGRIKFYTTGNKHKLNQAVKVFLGQKIKSEQVKI